jgi:prophage regulatory protein
LIFTFSVILSESQHVSGAITLNAANQSVAAPNCRLRLPQILKRTGYSRATLYRRIKAGEFPAPGKDRRISYWPSSEVDAWDAGSRA